MKHVSKLLFVALFLVLNFPIVQIKAQHTDPAYIKADSILFFENISADTAFVTAAVESPKHHSYILLKPSHPEDIAIHFVDSLTRKYRLDSIMSIPLSRTDSLLYASNPLFLPLIYTGKDLKSVWDVNQNLMTLISNVNDDFHLKPRPKTTSSENFAADLRKGARDYISNTAMHLYVTTIDRLPNLSTFMSRPIKGSRVNPLAVHEDKIDLGTKKIELSDLEYIYWTKKANALLQFSQNYVSSNWYQGGNSNFAFLSIITGQKN